MALTLSSSKTKTLLSRLKPYIALERFSFGYSVDGGRAWFSSDNSGNVGFSKWRKLDSRDLGIANELIPLYSWVVLRSLRAAGYEAYLVGGCVRDLLLNKVPKDFDVITTAGLKQIKKTFSRAVIVGKRFPICRVSVKGFVVEVSSFDTIAEKSNRKTVSFSQMPIGCNEIDYVRWKNCMHRDFTVNSLFYDPFVSKIFDYTDAMMDLRYLKLRTVTPAHLSFKEDQARILRGIRLAARLNLSFSKESEEAIYNLSSSVADLSKPRLILEMNYMLSYGAAEPSLLLLKKFNLLEMLLPFHAAYLSQHADNQLGLRSSMLMKLFFNLDRWITCDRHCEDSLWVTLLAFHAALYRNPQHAVVILTFASLLYHGNWEESIKFARQHATAARIYVPETIDAFEDLSDEEIADRVTKFSIQVVNSVDVLTDMNCLMKAIPRFPGSGLVFVPHNLGKRVKNIFDILKIDVTSLKATNRSTQFNYSSLKVGNAYEVRFMVGTIILDTLLRGVANANKDDTKVIDPPQKFGLSKHDSVDEDENKRNILPPGDEQSSKRVSLAGKVIDPPHDSVDKDEKKRNVLPSGNEHSPKRVGLSRLFKNKRITAGLRKD